MNRIQVSSLLASVLMLGGLSGCGSTCNSRCGYLSTPRTAVVPTCDRCGVGGPQPPRFNPTPPPIVPGAPSPAAAAPLPAGEIQQNAYVPPGPANSPPPSGGAPGVYLAPPEPAEAQPMQPTQPTQPMQPVRPAPTEPGPARDATRLYPPQTAEPPAAPPAKNGSASPAMPVDIPQFTVVKTDVAYGQEPFADGVRWLKAHGYRTVLHLRAPGEDDKAAQAEFEKNGLRYLSLEVSPQTLSKDMVDQFNRLVADTANLPLFVYDKDSSLAGGLWYLHFRIVDKQTDEKARAAAAQLGFKEDQDGPHRTMWLAVQNYLQNEKP